MLRTVSPDVLLFVGMIVATILIAVTGLLLSRILNACSSPLRSLSVIGAACVGMGLLLAFSEIYATHRRQLEGNVDLWLLSFGTDWREVGRLALVF